jgi:hypothetical protein
MTVDKLWAWRESYLSTATTQFRYKSKGTSKIGFEVDKWLMSK